VRSSHVLGVVVVDYAFVHPDPDQHHENLRELFRRRTNTRLRTGGRLGCVKDLIDDLDSDSDVRLSHPVEDLFMASHASGEGVVWFELYRGQGGPTTFEEIEDSIATARHSVRIPATLIPAVVSPATPTHSVHIKGCNVGKERATARTPRHPFLVKLKEALGGNVDVTAPKHFHGATPVPGVGTFEYLCYQFILRVKPSARPSRSPLADGQAARTAFAAAPGMVMHDGTTAVTAADWARFIPRRISVVNGARNERQVPVPLGTTIGTTTVSVPHQVRAEHDTHVEITRYSGGVPAGTDHIASAQAKMRADAQFLATHDFPVWERKGYRSFDDFLAGHLWTSSVSGIDVTVTGHRWEYTVVVPVVSLAAATAGQLIFNFYPEAGTTYTPVRSPLLAETNTAFFGRA
jgi:hypothetical protein